MSYVTKHIVKTLKAARESKGLSQRELSKKAGVPQGHISKIENSTVDLRLSSLVALARVLDLELTLVPRKTVPAVESIVRSSRRSTPPASQSVRQGLKELNRLQNTIARLTQANPGVKELAQLQRQVHTLKDFGIAIPDVEALKAANKAIQAFNNTAKGVEILRQTLSRIQSLRNALAHASIDAPKIEPARPAYILDEDDHG